MVLQAYIDESHANESDVFCMGGHIADINSWQKFSEEWAELLPRFGVLDDSDQYHFKMSEMYRNNRIDNVPPFYRVIERHVLCSLAFSYKKSDLENAKNRIFVPELQIDWGFLNNPYEFAFRSLMDMFHSYREQAQEVIPLEEKVDFIFDEHNKSKMIDKIWDDYMSQRPEETRKYYGSHPRFKNDKEALPLQAADLWAWWVRKWTEDGTPEQQEMPDFGAWKAHRNHHPKLHISMNEDQVVAFIKSYLREHVPSHKIIYDLSYRSCQIRN